MVSDMARSVRFHRDILGMTLIMTVSPEREVGWPGEPTGAAFAVLEWDGAQLMLQTVESLSGELSVFAPDHAPAPSATIYFRGLHPGSVQDRVAAEDVVKGPKRSWYGMMELYVQDPDGYVICVGAPQGGIVGVSMVLGGRSGTGALDPRPVAHSEKLQRQDRTNAWGMEPGRVRYAYGSARRHGVMQQYAADGVARRRWC